MIQTEHVMHGSVATGDLCLGGRLRAGFELLCSVGRHLDRIGRLSGGVR